MARVAVPFLKKVPWNIVVEAECLDRDILWKSLRLVADVKVLKLATLYISSGIAQAKASFSLLYNIIQYDLVCPV